MLIDMPPYNQFKVIYKDSVMKSAGFIRRTNMVGQQTKGFASLVVPQWPFQPCAEAEIKAIGLVFLRLNPTLSSSCENSLSQTDLALSPREKVRSSEPALESCCGFSLGEHAVLVSGDTALRFSKTMETGPGEKPEQHHQNINLGPCYKSLHKVLDFGIGGI